MFTLFVNKLVWIAWILDLSKDGFSKDLISTLSLLGIQGRRQDIQKDLQTTKYKKKNQCLHKTKPIVVLLDWISRSLETYFP